MSESKTDVKTEEKNDTDSEDDTNSEEKSDTLSLVLTSIVVVSGILAGYLSFSYFEPVSRGAFIPVIGIIFGQITVLTILDIPEDRGPKNDAFVLFMTLAVWFVSFTVFLQQI